MSEANLWQRVRKGLEGFGHLQRIESGVTDSGIPDVNYCFGGKEGWFEMKHGDEPKRITTSVFKSQRGLDPQQIEWLLYRWKNGGRVFILAQVGAWLVLLHGSQAARFNDMTLEDMKRVADWHHRGAMTSDLWRQVAEILCSGY